MVRIYFALTTNLSLIDSCRSIKSQVDMSVEIQERFQHVQHLCHLRENEHAMRTVLESSQQPVERLQFATVILYETRMRKLCYHAGRNVMQRLGRFAQLQRKLLALLYSAPVRAWVRIPHLQLGFRRVGRRHVNNKSANEKLS